MAASPTVVGAVTTLIVIVAVFLAYNANNGLPFVPVYRASLEVPDAARLTNNNEVRIGGHRVGVVESIDAVQPQGGGRAIARLNLKLDKSAQPLPKDSIFRVRYRSSFGLKYLEIVRGVGEPAPEGFTFVGTDDGATCRLPTNPAVFASSTPESSQNGCFQSQTEFDDINSTFDTATRTNARTNLEGFGNGFAGRGTSLNDAIYALEPLFGDLKPVARLLSARETRLGRFFAELGDAARIVAPVAEQQAQLFTNMATTFGAISRDPVALQETITEGVPALETAIDLLPNQRPFLRDFTVLSRELRPGVADLRATLPVLNEAVEVGTPVLADSTATNQRLEGALGALNRLVSQPATKVTLQRLEETFDGAKRLAKFVAPAQTVCNYWNYWFTFLPEHLTERDPVGFQERVTLLTTPPGAQQIGIGPAQVTVPGEVETAMGGYSGISANGKAGPVPNPADAGVFKPHELPILHGPTYTIGGQRHDDCQRGQFGYPLGAMAYPGHRADSPATTDGNYPGSVGPTTLFFDANGDRALEDTRIPSRAPQTWKAGQP